MQYLPVQDKRRQAQLITQMAEPILPSQIHIIGNSGLLGSALAERASSLDMYRDLRAGSCCVSIDGRELLEWLSTCYEEKVDALVAATGPRQDWVYAVGVIDPSVDADELDWVNNAAPGRLLEVLERVAQQRQLAAGSLRLITVGSALEDRAEIVAANSYMRSRANLFARFLRHQDDVSEHAVEWSHIRLHTLYGRRRPPPFMFLGQMEAALRKGMKFAMSSGQQLREYHHADDVAENILTYLGDESARTKTDLLVLSNGRPIRIGELASRVFEHFGRSDLLQIGAVSAQPGEVYQVGFPRSPYVVADRDAVEGIVAWLADLGIEKGLPCGV